MALGDSAADPFLIKQNDTRPKLRYNLKQGTNQTPIDITGATVVFNMRPSAGGSVVANRVSATIVSAATGVVEWTPTTGHTATVGDYLGEFEITFSDGGILTVPSGSNYIYIRVGDDIA